MKLHILPIQKRLLRLLGLTILFPLLLIDCRPRYVLSELPEYMYPDMGGYFLDYQALVEKEELTWLQAAEWQNGMRDCLLARSLDFHLHFEALEACYNEGRSRIKNPESGYSRPDFKKGEFIVAFDLDETLLSQWYEAGSRGEYNLQTTVPDYYVKDGRINYGPRYASLIPGWQQAFKRLWAIPECRGIVLYTAKDDTATHALLRNWFIEKNGQKMNIREAVLGVFTRNYLTRNARVLKPSKDLRLLDESLKHVVIIDDNPTRLFQPSNVRVFPVYSADLYLKNKVALNDITKYYTGLLDHVVDEITEAAVYARLNGVHFSRAYFPYTQRGRPYLNAVEAVLGNRAAALKLIRTKPALSRPHYYQVSSEPIEEAGRISPAGIQPAK